MAAPPKAARPSKRDMPPKSPPQHLGIQTPLTCPVCDQDFLGNLPPSARFAGRESDLRPLFCGDVDPLTALIQFCPHCHFAAYPRGFGHRSEILDELEEQCTSSPGDRPIPVIAQMDEETRADLRRWLQRENLAGVLRNPAQRYLLAARCHDYVSSEDASLLADYFLRASWAARSNGDQHQEMACRAEAIDRLWLMADDEMQPMGDKVRTLFLLGELSRRQGDFTTAIDLFTQLEDCSFEPNEQGELEALFFSRQAERLLPLACMKSDVNARLWDIDDDFFDEDEENRGGKSGPGDLA